MILKIVIAFFLALLINKIIRNIRTNRMRTISLPDKERRKLLWRYGPFVMEACIVEYHRNQIRKKEVGIIQPAKAKQEIGEPETIF
jgi:hypothetical protein